MTLTFPKLEKKPNLFLWAIIGAVAGLALFYCWSLRVEPIATYVSPLMTPIQGFAQGLVAQFSGAINTLVGYVNQNPLAAITGGVTALAALYTVYNKFQANQKANEAQQQISEARATAIQASQQAQQYKIQLDSLQNQAKPADLSGQISTLQGTIISKDKQIEQLLNQKNEAESILKIIEAPSAEDMIKKLKKEGYTIIKTVD